MRSFTCTHECGEGEIFDWNIADIHEISNYFMREKYFNLEHELRDVECSVFLAFRAASTGAEPGELGAFALCFPLFARNGGPEIKVAPETSGRSPSSGFDLMSFAPIAFPPWGRVDARKGDEANA